MPTTPPINLGSHPNNIPTDVEKTTMRDRLGIKSAALLNASFINPNTLQIADPTNSLNTITIDKTLIGGGVAERLAIPRTFNITGDLTTSPIPSFDGTSNVSLIVSINSGSVTETKLANNSVVAGKIKNGEITPNKLSSGGPSWTIGTTGLQRRVSLGESGTDAESSLDLYSSATTVSGGNARIIRASGVNGALTLTNAGTGDIVIRGLAAKSDNTLVSSNQFIGNLEIVSSQINGTYSETTLNSGIAINYENSDGGIANFLDITVYDGKRNAVSKFIGLSKTLETYGSFRAIRNSQTTADTAAIQARSGTGNVAVLLNADGSNVDIGGGVFRSGAAIVHERNIPGLQIRYDTLTGDAPLRAGAITTTGLTSSGNISSSGTVSATTVSATTVSATTVTATSSITVGGGTGTINGVASAVADASVSAAKLNGAQTGTAPIYGVRAWGNFDATTDTDLSGTYTRTSSTTVTISATNHGLLAGHAIYLDFTVGTGTAPFDGLYLVDAVTNANTFTVISSIDTTSTGTVVLKRRLIRASGNVSSVTPAYDGLNLTTPVTSSKSITIGQYLINFTLPMPNNDYILSGSGLDGNPLSINNDSFSNIFSGIKVTDKCARVQTTTVGGNVVDCWQTHVMVIG